MKPLKCGNHRCAYCNQNGTCIDMSIIKPEKCQDWSDIEIPKTSRSQECNKKDCSFYLKSTYLCCMKGYIDPVDCPDFQRFNAVDLGDLDKEIIEDQIYTMSDHLRHAIGHSVEQTEGEPEPETVDTEPPTVDQAEEKKEPHCSFCKKSSKHVKLMIGEDKTSDIYICDSCVEICAKIVAEKLKADHPVDQNDMVEKPNHNCYNYDCGFLDKKAKNNCSNQHIPVLKDTGPVCPNIERLDRRKYDGEAYTRDSVVLRNKGRIDELVSAHWNHMEKALAAGQDREQLFTWDQVMAMRKWDYTSAAIHFYGHGYEDREAAE